MRAGVRMQPIVEAPTLSGALRGGWGRFVQAVRPRPHRRHTRRGIEPRPVSAVDPVKLTIMAVNRLGPATLRAVWNGMPITVAAPDRQTAEIFRAALLQMGKARPTDRLVSVALSDEA
jgi:hypothetical protein